MITFEGVSKFHSGRRGIGPAQAARDLALRARLGK